MASMTPVWETFGKSKKALVKDLWEERMEPGVAKKTASTIGYKDRPPLLGVVGVSTRNLKWQI